jgi:hypothetical protein
VFLGNEQSINVIVPLDDKLNVITVAEMSDPLTRLSRKLDRLTIYIDRVCEGNFFIPKNFLLFYLAIWESEYSNKQQLINP